MYHVNHVAGFLCENDGYIAGVLFDNEYGHHGIGTKLLNHIKEQRDNPKYSVHVQNTTALSFYRKNDFRVQNIDRNTDELKYEMYWSE